MTRRQITLALSTYHAWLASAGRRPITLPRVAILAKPLPAEAGAKQ